MTRGFFRCWLVKATVWRKTKQLFLNFLFWLLAKLFPSHDQRNFLWKKLNDTLTEKFRIYLNGGPENHFYAKTHYYQALDQLSNHSPQVQNIVIKKCLFQVLLWQWVFSTFQVKLNKITDLTVNLFCEIKHTLVGSPAGGNAWKDKHIDKLFCMQNIKWKVLLTSKLWKDLWNCKDLLPNNTKTNGK